MSVAAHAARPAPSAEPDRVNQASAHKAHAKNGSVIGIDPRYAELGFSRNNSMPTIPAALDANARRKVENRNTPASVCAIAAGIQPASPVRHHAASRANHSMIQ
jgi:hypothetical protein